ncbi:MAG: hypothetical protein ACHRXM_02980 [Isosphaerales bacterium]
MPKALYQGTDKVLNRECDVFLFAKVRWIFPQDHVYYLDKSTSIPLRVVSYRDQAARDKNLPLWVWTAESLDKVQEHFVPLKSRMISYTEGQEPSFEWSYRVLSIEFDKDYANSTFWSTLQPGVGVIDTITSKGYEVPGGKKEAAAAKDSEAATAQPIEAVAAGDWATIAPWVSLVLGCVILMTGGLLWWRRR